MAYPRAHSLLTFFGDGYSAQEIWNCTLRLDSTQTPDQAELEAAATAFQALWNDGTLASPSSRRFLGVKWAPQDTQGRYPDGLDAVEFLLEDPDPGTTGGGYPQIALVLSWRTARSRGYASNGRMYVPSAREVSTASGQIDATQADALAGVAATFINAIAASGVGTPAVMSSAGAGRIEEITGVRVGRVMDTQRRRRNALDEAYTATVPVPT